MLENPERASNVKVGKSNMAEEDTGEIDKATRGESLWAMSRNLDLFEA